MARVKAIVLVYTSGLVPARILVTLRSLELTVRTGKAIFADTCIIVDSVDTISAIHARTGRAVLVVDLAINSREAALAFADVRVDVILTYS